MSNNLNTSSKNETELSHSYEKDSVSNAVIECTRCILSTKEVKNITFNKAGLCNYCEQYDSTMLSLGNKDQRLAILEKKIIEIKESGKNKKYDCVVGVSGGVDSTYLAYWCKQNNLRPLIVHFDNGWNSDNATINIKNICNTLEFDLITKVVNWEEFKELQLSYLRASVIDIEVLTDHAIYATILKVAKKNNIKFALSGFNDSTEGIMPRGWAFNKRDWSNIKDIYKKYGSGKKLKTYPHVTFFDKLYYYWFLNISTVKVLNYIDYNKADAIQTVKNKLNWQEVGGKHFESLFTKFYQVYILPKKFKIDKRLPHLSNLICSGQITKADALKEMALPLYDEIQILQEKEYVIKKLGLSESAFDAIMLDKPKKHNDFKTEKQMWNNYFMLIRIFKFWSK